MTLRMMEGSVGGSAQIYFEQKYLSLKSGLDFSELYIRKGLPEALPRFILGRNALTSNGYLTFSVLNMERSA